MTKMTALYGLFLHKQYYAVRRRKRNIEGSLLCQVEMAPFPSSPATRPTNAACHRPVSVGPEVKFECGASNLNLACRCTGCSHHPYLTVRTKWQEYRVKSMPGSVSESI